MLYTKNVRKNDLKVIVLLIALIIATDDLVASLTAQLETRKDSVNPSQLKDLELKGL